MFKQNEGILDRTVRVALGLVLLPVGLFLLGGLQASALGLVVASLGGWLLITGITGVCPLYIPLGINTLEKEKELFARGMSRMSSFCQRFAPSGQSCGSCSPSISKTQ